MLKDTVSFADTDLPLDPHACFAASPGRSKVTFMKVGTKAGGRKEVDFVLHRFSVGSLSELKHLSQDGERVAVDAA